MLNHLSSLLHHCSSYTKRLQPMYLPASLLSFYLIDATAHLAFRYLIPVFHAHGRAKQYCKWYVVRFDVCQNGTSCISSWCPMVNSNPSNHTCLYMFSILRPVASLRAVCSFQLHFLISHLEDRDLPSVFRLQLLCCMFYLLNSIIYAQCWHSASCIGLHLPKFTEGSHGNFMQHQCEHVQR